MQPAPDALTLDPSADILHYDTRALDAFMAPKSVAIIGPYADRATSGGRDALPLRGCPAQWVDA